MKDPTRAKRNLSLQQFALLAASGALAVAGSLAFIRRLRIHRSPPPIIWAADPSPASSRPGSEPLSDEAAAAELYPFLRQSQTFRFDPLALLVRAPDYVENWDWPEHPSGRVVFRTNNRGFREDMPTAVAKLAVRILVAGDSHIDGVVDNSESYPNVLERLLNASGDPRPFEVLNAGTGFHAPSNYLGILRRNLDLKPDVFLATLYVGNDFAEELRLRDLRANRGRPPPPAEYFERLHQATECCPGAIPQVFNQVFRFVHFPDEAVEALEAAVETFEQMEKLCSAAGIRFWAVVLPTKADADLEDQRDTVEAVRRLLDLREVDCGINVRLGKAFAEALAARGISCIDPTEAMRDAPGAFYWRRDFHLSVDGHAFLAARVFERLRGQI